MLMMLMTMMMMDFRWSSFVSHRLTTASRGKWWKRWCPTPKITAAHLAFRIVSSTSSPV